MLKLSSDQAYEIGVAAAFADLGLQKRAGFRIPAEEGAVLFKAMSRRLEGVPLLRHYATGALGSAAGAGIGGLVGGEEGAGEGALVGALTGAGGSYFSDRLRRWIRDKNLASLVNQAENRMGGV